MNTGTPPLTHFFGPGKNRVKEKPRYRRSILVLKPKNDHHHQHDHLESGDSLPY